MTNSAQVKKLEDTIEMLERVRDQLLKDGQGPFISDDIFDRIDSLYCELQNMTL